MDIRLARVRLRNFRSLEDLVIDFGRTTILLGENNVGKSAILEGLAIAFGERQPVTGDLRVHPDGTSAKNFWIDLRLEPGQGSAFSASALDVLEKNVLLDTSAKTQVAYVRAFGEPEPTGRLVRLRRGFVSSWGASADVSLEDLRAGQREAFAYALLDAQRDLAQELRLRSSPWGRLLRRLRLDAAKRADLEKRLGALATEVLNAIPDAKALEDSLNDLGAALAGLAAPARLSMIPSRLEDLWRTTDLLIAAQGQTPLTIGAQGMGARSLAALLAFRAYLETELTALTEPPLLVVSAFEEPEAHLHPQAQRAVFDHIRRVPGQTILATHSPYVASVAGMDDYRVVRRQGVVTVSSSAGITTDQTVDQKALANVRRFCLHRNGHILFARLVVLGEGDTDAGVLPELARVWWAARPEERGVSIVPVDGAGNMRTFARFLSRLGIPWLALVDGDSGGLDEQRLMQQDPLLASLVPTAVVVVSHESQPVDIETLIVATARAAVARTLSSGDARHTEALMRKADSELATSLRGCKAWMSQRLGEELAVEWPEKARFAPAFSELFSRADRLL